MTVGHRAQKENFLFRDWTPFCVWLEASPLSPRGTLTAGMLLNYRCGSDSSNLPKCCELLPVPVPVKSSVPGGKHKPNETHSPLYSDVALDITFHNTFHNPCSV